MTLSSGQGHEAGFDDQMGTGGFEVKEAPPRCQTAPASALSEVHPPAKGSAAVGGAGAEVSGSPKETRDQDKQQQQLWADDGAVPMEDTIGMSPLISLSQSHPESTVSVPQEPVSPLTKQLALPELKPWDEVKTLPWEPVDLACGPVGGCLQKYLKNWKVVTRDPEILQMVHGVRIQFAQMPMLPGQNRWALDSAKASRRRWKSKSKN